ncbi:hypothetical protein [Inquilinus sp. Marseille-Q2685]|uniref:hypothetical protein n=1 Tax=Inquilinus sp. Marseille-Q2685 TaxID=2866581 RepID=UPI001CE42573|nr:hypothetical protein [Inquilinus sp. Marseille-Q2685]
MTIASSRPIPGTDDYWHDRREAFALIRRLENAIAACKDAPPYLPRPIDEEEDDYNPVVENTGPRQRAYLLQWQACDNPTVVEILTAQKRLHHIE